MKGIRELVGLSLICIAEGLEYGKIKDVILNPDSRRLEYLMIDDGQWYMGVKVLPYRKVLGMGGDAVITETASAIRPLHEVEDALALAKRNFSIQGIRVFTRKGKYAGEVEECFFREEDGSLAECRLAGHRALAVPADRILSIGRDVMVIAEEADENLQRVEESGEKENPSEEEVGREKEQIPMQEKEADPPDQLELRQRQFLLGRLASKALINEEGEVLVADGEVITEEILNKVKENGMLVELTMNSKPA